MKFEKTEYPFRGGVLKEALIEIRGHKCEKCGLSTWLNQPIPLEAHHIDGDRCNNLLENLELLCPNCHTLTPNYGSKKYHTYEISDDMLLEALKNNDSIRQALFSLNMSDAGANYERARVVIKNSKDENLLNKFIPRFPNSVEKIKYCPDCGKIITLGANRCQECAKKASRVVERPDRETLKQEVYENTFVDLGKKYGVSYKSIQKWCDYYKLPSRRKDINTYTKESWMAL